jgi:hypothetical protein
MISNLSLRAREVVQIRRAGARSVVCAQLGRVRSCRLCGQRRFGHLRLVRRRVDQGPILGWPAPSLQPPSREGRVICWLPPNDGSQGPLP